MRKQDKLIVWPIYFDSSKTRKDGRRVTRTLAVQSPTISEIREAAEKIHLSCELVSEASHPKTPWLKSGSLLVKKNQAKDKIIREIAKQLQETRNAQVEK